MTVYASPILLEPPGEGGEQERDGLGVVAQRLAADHAEGREQPGGADFLVVHGLEPRVPVLGPDRLVAPQQL